MCKDSARLDTLEARLARLEAAVAALADQVTTRRLAVVDERGRERIVATADLDAEQAELVVVDLAGPDDDAIGHAGLSVVGADGEVAVVVGVDGVRVAEGVE